MRFTIPFLVGTVLFAQEHFVPVEPTGLPYLIVIDSLVVDGEWPDSYGEIGVFDGDLCVGTVDWDNYEGQNLTITAWQGDAAHGLDGFVPGNSISYNVWSSVYGDFVERSASAEYSQGDGTFGYGSYTVASLIAESGLAPVIQLSSYDLSFGPVFIGQMYTNTLIVTNPGNALLTVASITSESPQFSSVPTSFDLEPGSTQYITVSYTPDELLPDTSVLTIESDDPVNSLVEVQLQGEVFHPDIAVEPLSLDFGAVNIGAEGSLTFQISNEGSYELTVSSINSTDNQFTASPSSISVSAGANASITVAFTPLSTGIFPAALTIASNDPYEGTVTMDMTGQGLPQLMPVISVSPGSFDFGAVVIGSSSSTQVDIANQGNDVLHIIALSTSSPVFSVEYGNFNILPGQIQSINVSYSPIAKLLNNGSLTVYSNDPTNGEMQVSLSGFGYDEHFDPVEPTGMPYTIVVASATVDEQGLDLGDEIAVFDGDLCVGVGIFGDTDTLTITAWQENIDYDLDGFTVGDSMLFTIWTTTFGTTLEIGATPAYQSGNGSFGYGASKVDLLYRD